jgi:hypothetical protein
MTRRALIIANPGEKGKDGYCAGVEVDVSLYRDFLMSPSGGYWSHSEINVLHQPNVDTVKTIIKLQNLHDYSMTIFCGHGHFSSSSKSTVIQLKAGSYMDSNELRGGATKHTLILDCCREVMRPTRIVMDSVAIMAKSMNTLNDRDCRKYYDKRIEDCAPGIIVCHACSVGETAGDSSSEGGFYSSSLIDAVESWQKETRVNTQENYKIFSVVSAHDRAQPSVIFKSGQRQHPQIEKPRSEKHFPFAIIA